MNPGLRIFVSCVSDEFRSYRNDLRQHLAAQRRDVKIQEDFLDGAGTLLEKLDSYISAAQALIHLVGSDTGVQAKPAEVRELLARYPDFAEVLPELKPHLEPAKCPFTYTQWECFLAIYHRVPCFIYRADLDSQREHGWKKDATKTVAQDAHVNRLRALGQDRKTLPFKDARDVAMRFLSSLMEEMQGLGPGSSDDNREISWPDRPSIVKYNLADRENEIQAFLDLITGNTDERLLFVHGPSDRGKSVLLAAFAEIARSMPGLRFAHAEFKSGPPLHEVLWDLILDLKPLRFPRCEREWTRGAFDNLKTAFLQDLDEAREPIVLMLDTYEQAVAETTRWIEQRFLPHFRRNDEIRLVLAGQKVPQADACRLGTGMALVQELSPISDSHYWCEYSQRVLRLNNLRDDQIALLVDATSGSPRMVSTLLANLKKKAK